MERKRENGRAKKRTGRAHARERKMQHAQGLHMAWAGGRAGRGGEGVGRGPQHTCSCRRCCGRCSATQCPSPGSPSRSPSYCCNSRPISGSRPPMTPFEKRRKTTRRKHAPPPKSGSPCTNQHGGGGSTGKSAQERYDASYDESRAGHAIGSGLTNVSASIFSSARS